MDFPIFFLLFNVCDLVGISKMYIVTCICVYLSNLYVHGYYLYKNRISGQIAQ